MVLVLGIVGLRLAAAVTPKLRRAAAKRPGSWTAWSHLVHGIERLRYKEFQHDAARIRGVFSDTALKKGDTVLEVPAEMAFTACSQGSQVLFGPQSAAGAPLDERRRLIGLLAVQRQLGKLSTWAPYVKHMPSLDSYRANHPLFTSVVNIWRFSSLPEVQAAMFLQSVKFQDWEVWKSFVHTKELDARANAAKDPTSAAALVGAARKVTSADYDWAFATLLTRGVIGGGYLPKGDGCMFSMALEPAGDDFNTDTQDKQNVKWGYDSKTGAFRVVASRAVARGKELLEPYTAVDDNEHLAGHWGVSLPGNPHLVQPMGKAQCLALRTNLLTAGVKPLPDAATGRTLAADEPACQPPAGETQVDNFCLLMRLSREHCRAVDPAFP